MASKKVEIQKWKRIFLEREGRDLTAHEIAEMLEKQGWPMPRPKAAIEILAKQVSEALSEETVFDEVLGESVDANICYQARSGGKSDGKQAPLWTELDTATRDKVELNKTLRRDGMVGDAYRSTLIIMRWNRLHDDEEPVQLDLDLGPDVEWRLAAKEKPDADAA
jgi:hypothetical protein